MVPNASFGDDPDRRSVVFTCYVDDSGTDGQSKLVTVGACVLDRESFVRFDQRWRKMLHLYRIDSLHMTDFVRPYGKHVGIRRELKIALFTEAARIINSRKDSSFSIAVTNADFKKAIPTEFHRSAIGPYGAAFVALALWNSRIANHHDYPAKTTSWPRTIGWSFITRLPVPIRAHWRGIAYLVDEGSPFAEQLRLGHLLVKAFEKRQGPVIRTGSFAFADDNDVSALQGADVLAWASRRKFSGDGLDNEYSPLNDLFSQRFNVRGVPVHPHFHYQVQDDLAEKIMEQLTSDGDATFKRAILALQSVIGDSTI